MITAFAVRAVFEAALLAALRTNPKPGEPMVLVDAPMGLLTETRQLPPPRASRPSAPARPPAPRRKQPGGPHEALYQRRGVVDVAPTAKDAFLAILRTLAAKTAPSASASRRLSPVAK